MLKVEFKKYEDTISLMLDGHAYHDSKGHDIVCAAGSILAYTVAQIVRSETADRNMKDEPVLELGNGYTYISCRPKTEKYDEILHAFYVAEVGYRLLNHKYPQCVDVDVSMFGEA